MASSAYEYFTDSTNTLNIKSDVTLIVGKERFYCHRLLLSLVSPVFTRMFDGEFKEHNENDIALEGKTSESILELLKYIYPQFHGQITNENVEDFLLLADEYMIEHLKQPCKDVLIQQLQNFKYVSLPTQQKLESVKSQTFHSSDPALDAHPRSEDDVNRSIFSSSSSRRPISTIRSSTNKSSYFKSNDKTHSSSNTHPRYILFLDKTRMPIFYDAQNTRIDCTTNDIELWLRRLRILYQIDKGRNYGEVIDWILSILQFIPANLLFTLAHTNQETFVIDELMLNDIARARMFMLEEWTSNGDPYRLVCLTESYQTLSLNVLNSNCQQSDTSSINSIPIEQNLSQETLFASSDLETSAIGLQFNINEFD